MKKVLVLFLICLLGSCGQQVQVKPPPDLLGKWQDAENREGMEFARDGTLTIVRDQEPPLTGKYRCLAEGLMEVDLRPTVTEPVKVKVSVGAQELTQSAQLTLKDRQGIYADAKVEAVSSWKRVPDWALVPRAADPAAGGQQRQWLIGKWQSATDGETWDYYDDGTFAHWKEGYSQPSLSLGTYDLANDSAKTLACRYPDTGRADTRYVSVTPEQLLLGRENPESTLVLLRTLTKYRRAGNPTSDYRPVRADALTAYQLHLDWQTDPVAAEKKYKGKEVQIVGRVGSRTSSSFGSTFHDEKGKRMMKDSTLTKLFLVTGEGQNVLCLFEGKGNTERIDKLSPMWKSQEKPRQLFVIRGQCVGVTDDQGKDVFLKVTIDGNSPKVRLDHCSLVEDAPTKVGDK